MRKEEEKEGVRGEEREERGKRGEERGKMRDKDN